jgi:hypothetical protein
MEKLTILGPITENDSTINKMSKLNLSNQPNIVTNIKNPNQIIYNENELRLNKMSKINLKNQSCAVKSTKQTNNYNNEDDMSCYYKPSRNYDSSEGFKLPDTFCNKNGKFDTSKKYIGLKNNQWRNNRSYDFVSTRKTKLNAKGKFQGDRVKHTSLPLPPQKFKVHVKEVEKNFSENKFWAHYDELEEGKPIYNSEYPEYFDFLCDEEQMEIYEDSYVFIDTNDVIDYVPEQSVQIDNKIVDNVQEQQIVQINNKYDILQILDDTTRQKLDNLKDDRVTQGLVYLSYIADAVSAVGGAAGTYYGYRMVSDIITSLRGVSDSSSGIFDLIKDHIIDIIAMVTILAKFYNGTLTLSDSIAIITGYAIGKAYMKAIVEPLLKFFTMLVPAQSNTRHTQGADMTTFAQGVISIIAVFFLGTVPENFSAKSILNSIKSLGSTLLTIKTFEAVLCHMITLLPDILMQILCCNFPLLSMYITVSTDRAFKSFMDKIVELKRYKTHEIVYNSHRLAQFLDAHKYLKDYIITEDNVNRGMADLLADYVKWFDEVYTVAGKIGVLPGRRSMPYVIWLSGEPGIGKSTLAADLARQTARLMMTESFGEDSDITDDDLNSYIYSHNTTNKFFDGYNNQPIFILNDYLQFTNESEEQWLIRFVDTIDVPLEVSSVDNISQGIKGEVRFTSRIIIITSNTSYLNSSPNVINVDAFNRRRNIVVKLDWKNPNSKVVDFNNFEYQWANFQYLEPTIAGAYSRNLWMLETLDEFKTDIVSSIRKFADRSALIVEKSRSSGNGTLLISDKINRLQAVKTAFQEMLERATFMAKTILELEVFVIPGTTWYNKKSIRIKHLLPLCIVGTASYLAFQSASNFFHEKITQSLSGDVSTRKYAPERKPLKRYTMGNSINMQTICTTVNKNFCQIATIITTADGRRIQQAMWGYFIGGSFLITPKHLWKRGDSFIDKGDKIIITFKDITYEFEFRSEDLFTDEKRDLACYNTCNKIPFSKSVEHLLLNENVKINTSGEEGVLVFPTNENFPLIFGVNAYIRDAPYSDPFGGKYEGSEIWQYNAKTVQGNCGSILVVNFRDKVLIAGMHVAGDAYTGNAEILDTLFVQNAKDYFSRKTQGFATDAVFDDEEYFDATSDFDEGFIFLGKSKTAPFQTSTTEIRKGPFYEVLQPHTTEPAILKPSDPRLQEVVSPILKSVVRFGERIEPFKYSKLDAAFRIVKSFYSDLNVETFEVYSHNDAINSTHTPYLEKLDLRTSAGYPWNCTRKTKRDLIDNKNGVYAIRQELGDKLNTFENLLDKNTMFPYTLTTTLKDERVPLAKIPIGKTRTFMNFPVEYTILMRRYFDSFINFETKYAREIGTTVGINIYSNNWDSIYQELKRFDFHLDGDYKGFDGTIRPEFFEYYARLVNSFYNDKYTNHRNLLVQGCCFAPIFILDKVYLKQKGNPSGSRLTTSFNSFVNRMYVVMSMLDVLPQGYHTVDFFKSNMKMYAHGDDHLIGFSKLLKNYWNGHILRDFMRGHNIEYTSSKKDQPLVEHCLLEECYYLKSHFVFDKETKRIRCGLDKSVIQEMVSWQRDDDEESTRMILSTCLRYAYFWGSEYFNDIRNKLVEAAKVRKFHTKFPYYEDLDNEYQYVGQLSFDYIN